MATLLRLMKTASVIVGLAGMLWAVTALFSGSGLQMPGVVILASLALYAFAAFFLKRLT